MGHINFGNIVKIKSANIIINLPNIIIPIDTMCRECQLGKKTKRRFKHKEYSTSKPLELVHIDLCGHTRTRGLNSEKYKFCCL